MGNAGKPGRRVSARRVLKTDPLVLGTNVLVGCSYRRAPLAGAGTW